MIESGFRGMEDEIIDPNDYGFDYWDLVVLYHL